MKEKIAILTVNFNSSEKTLKLLESLKKSSYKNFNVYIVDNSSEKKDIKTLLNLIKKFNFKIKVIKNKENRGWGMGLNHGFKEIIKDKILYTFVLVNDGQFDKNTLIECLNVMKSHPDAGICGAKLMTFDKKIASTGGKINFFTKITGIPFENKGRRYEKNIVMLRKNEFVDDCGWMVRSDLMKKIGFYPDYLFMYFEEIYVNKMIMEIGYNVYYNPKAVIFHGDYGSSGGQKNPIPVFYLSRNRIIFMKEFYSSWFPLFILVYFTAVAPLLIGKYLIKKRGDLTRYFFLGIYSAIHYLLYKQMRFLIKKDGKLIIKRIGI